MHTDKFYGLDLPMLAHYCTGMDNLRSYGNAPFKVAVIHGGPGTAGGMAAVARELAAGLGVLEPLQTEATLQRQVEELNSVLEREADLPAVLIGHSWGAWLSYILAAQHPPLVKKLILVGCGGFTEEYAAMTHNTRLERLKPEEREELKQFVDSLKSQSQDEKNTAFSRMGEMFSRVDWFDPIEHVPEPVEFRADIFKSVWREAMELRRSGRLLELGKEVRCPTVAIHGDYDSHPAVGVERPLSAVIGDFRFILLENCGHKPWIERQARDRFYAVLKEEITSCLK